MVRWEIIGQHARHYSNEFKIRQTETGEVYDEAVDTIPCRYTYEETDIPREDEEVTADDVLCGLEGIL